MVTHIRKTTAAYYEISFDLSRVKGREMKFDVHCQRKGVQIHTLKNAVKGNSYVDMSPVEKKIFALNVVNGGTWSRMVSTVEAAKLKYTDSDTRAIEVAVPDQMTTKNADIFLIVNDPNGKKTSVQMRNKSLDSREKIILGKQADNKLKQFIVLIEPDSPYCIYSRVK